MDNYRNKQLLDYYREQEELEAVYEREFSAECEKWVMEAVKAECGIRDPQAYVAQNYTSYKVAMEAVQLALDHERTYNQGGGRHV